MIIDILLLVIGIIRFGTIFLQQAQGHQSRSTHVDRRFPLIEITLARLMVQPHTSDIILGEIHGVALHQVFGLNGCQHRINPTKGAFALTFDGRGFQPHFIRKGGLLFCLSLSTCKEQKADDRNINN